MATCCVTSMSKVKGQKCVNAGRTDFCFVCGRSIIRSIRIYVFRNVKFKLNLETNISNDMILNQIPHTLQLV